MKFVQLIFRKIIKIEGFTAITW